MHVMLCELYSKLITLLSLLLSVADLSAAQPNASAVRGQVSAQEACTECPHQAQKHVKVLWMNTCGREV